jgi:outer membrane lipoprotein SlyB
MNRLKFSLMLVLLMFLTGCTAAQQGATLGGLGGMAGSAVGKGDRSTTAIAGGIGAAAGYMLGNEIDKQNRSHIEAAGQTTTPRTDCRKIVTRKTVNGEMIETIEEVCEGKKSTAAY